MRLSKDVELSSYSTMGLGGKAAFLVEIASKDELKEAVSWAKSNSKSIIMIGGGSNTIWKDEGFDGLVLVNKIMGFETSEQFEDNFYVTIGAGEKWDSVVARSVEQGLTGIEALSLIPGLAGATPVQNVGAYGQEISQTLVTLEAYDSQESKTVVIAGSDCNFSYRKSRFKLEDKHRYYITSLTLNLRRGNPLPPFYPSIKDYFERHNISAYTPALVRQAVIEIRSNKLPDPELVKNSGSFFYNPIVSAAVFNNISANYEMMPHWQNGEKVKLSAAWLIEQAGLKDYYDEASGMATWAKQPLVFINEHAKTTSDLLSFKKLVVDKVYAKFGITLKQEPELLP